MSGSVDRRRRVMSATALAGLLAVVGATAGVEPPARAAVVDAGGDPAVLAPANLAGQPVPSPAGLAAALRKPLSGRVFGGSVQVSVLDPADGRELFGSNSAQPATPASTTKILTALAALRGYGPDAHLPTTVVRTAPGRLVLVGGGDPLLQVKATKASSLASLDQLARQTAAALHAGAAGSVPAVEVGFDDSLFTGPTAAAGWEPKYTKTPGALVPPITALMADEGFVGGTVDPVPAAEAAKAFVAQLKAQGIKVRGAPSRTSPAPGSEPLAQVFSPAMSRIVGHMLVHSDNTVAEVLGHLAGGRLVGSYSFVGGAAATNQVLSGLGIDPTGVTLNDASGLSRADRIPPRVLAQALAAAAVDTDGSLWPLGSGLPVAGFDGTLARRFGSAAAASGRGYVRAKTGTLTGVTALAGTVVDANGATLIFVFMVPNTPDGTAAAAGLDRAAAILAGCGCGTAAAGAVSAGGPVTGAASART